ncbi:MAG TPA: hypothetical protein VIA18_20885 [Polyangia bacterium]|nr:hypothetical protein [Polyangia bacterium]
MLLALLASAANVAASPEKPKLAVVPFTGPQAKKAEAVVVRALRKKARIVPQTVWVKAAKKLFAKSHSAEDLSAVADDVGAQVVITGLVHRDGRAWQLSVSVRDGKTGKVHDRLRYPLKVPRLTGATLSLLAKEVTDAFEATLGGGPSPETTEAPVETKITPPGGTATTTAPPPPTTTTTEVEPPPPPPRHTSRNGSRKPAPIATTMEPPPPSSAPSSSDKRPSWSPYFDIAAGLTISGRSFSFSPASQPKFTSGIVAGVHGDATVYPFASFWRGGGRFVSGLGVGATIDKPFWPDSTSKQDPTQKFATSELRVEGGIRWRIVLSKALPRPQLLVQAQYGLHEFTLQKDPLMGDVGPPDVSYQYATFGLGIRVHFAEWMYLWAMFNYHYVLSSGSITNTGSEYGPASNFGVRISGGLDFFVYKGLKIGVGGMYERFGLTFHPPANVTPAKTATSAVDQYFGGLISVGYVL